jgi:hypothetical protein
VRRQRSAARGGGRPYEISSDDEQFIVTTANTRPESVGRTLDIAIGSADSVEDASVPPLEVRQPGFGAG